MQLKTRRFPLHIGISTLVVATVVILLGLLLGVVHRESKATAIRTADRLFSEINRKTLQRYEHILTSVAVLAGTAARMPAMASPPSRNGTSHPGLEVMIQALASCDYLFSTYIGYEDGRFIQVTAVRDQPKVRFLFGAPAGTAYVLRTIAPGANGLPEQRWRFLDRNRQTIGERYDLDPGYDPRSRTWYLRAQVEDGAFYTAPYIFSSTQVPGITCAERLIGGGGVFGADITLERFTVSLKRQNVSANSRLFLFDRAGRIIAHPTEPSVKRGPGESLDFLTGRESGDPLARAVVTGEVLDWGAMVNQTREIEIGGTAYLVRLEPLKEALEFNQFLASIAPVADFTGHIRRMQQRIFLFAGLVLLAVLPVVLLISRKIAGSLVHLEHESRKIQQSDFSRSDPFDSSIKEIHSLIQAFILMKRTIRDYTARLIQAKQDIEHLFTSVTELIAATIDAKSPYTGGHCKRVPELARMLAAAASAAREGPLADFRIASEDQWREFEVSAWLHDCGKLTTPEYVVDKATKLETIYNRIHEIRMRFEVLLRDAEIDACRRRLTGDGGDTAILAELEKTKQQIMDDFAFVAACNIGGEFMTDGQIQRLEQIAARTWTRHLDDRLGLSEDETALKRKTPAPTLPVVEPVLADKPEHIIPRSDPEPYGETTHTFTMPIPEHQYNLGELYNLTIRKGTLTPEERFKINEHIIQTILMLEQLPFPDNMKQVPVIAGAHHETMDGTGYPRGLDKDEIPVAARIMAIADIFEALTAVDRPYKKPKSLNEALRLMSIMRDAQHIDADLFDLFLRRGIFREYADRFLDPAQIDAVDIRPYLSRPQS